MSRKRNGLPEKFSRRPRQANGQLLVISLFRHLKPQKSSFWSRNSWFWAHFLHEKIQFCMTYSIFRIFIFSLWHFFLARWRNLLFTLLTVVIHQFRDLDSVQLLLLRYCSVSQVTTICFRLGKWFWRTFTDCFWTEQSSSFLRKFQNDVLFTF